MLRSFVVLAFLTAPALAEPALTFEDDVLPILEARCIRCHGAEVKKSGLDLRRRFTIVEGGDSGPALVPGKPTESLLLEKIESKEMPPKDEDPLDAKQIAILTKWVERGAPLKAATEAPLDADEPDAGLTEEDRSFWAFQPPVRREPPAVRNGDRVRTPIDAFLLAKLEEQGLTFNPEASRPVLIRRLCFDLTGLPPTEDQLDRFLADTRPNAYELLVEELLSSSRYGERWGRHWLDVAGYADSDGYLEADRERPEAWRYRDYVIQSLNADKPYDQFLREQLAGDELSDWRQAPELTPEMQDQLIATGFLRTASDPTYPGYKEKPEIYKVLADTLQIVSATVFGVTVQCARCHAHKSEPISQRDYYQLQAVFYAAYDPDRWLASSERAVTLATEAQQARAKEWNGQADARIAQLMVRGNEIKARVRETLADETLAAVMPPLDDAKKAALRSALVAPAPNDEQKKLLAMSKLAITDAEILKALPRWPELNDEATRLLAAVKAESDLKRTFVSLRALADLDVKPAATHVLRRGDFNSKGKPVEPGVPAVLAKAGFRFEPQPGYKTTGRRKAFAEWVLLPDHPTTSRVHVNRVWAHHFGRGLVETLDDFGHLGKRPTHPELLDWLATEFIATGWSQKALHRLIVTSTAYRQASSHDEAKAAVDGENMLLWAFRPQRHEGEVVRDTLLAVSGKLNETMFGVPVNVAPQPDGSISTADDPQGNRRSVYIKVRRSQPVTLLESFDTPRMEVNCTRRTEAIVATQALVLQNNPFVEKAAQAFAARLVAQHSDRDTRMTHAYRQLFTREPTPEERQALHTFFDNFAKLAKQDAATSEPAAWPHAALALMNSNEFLWVD